MDPDKWLATITLLLLAVVLSGCVKLTHTDPAGNITEYIRIGEQQIDGMILTLPDGSEILFERQKSTIPVLIVTPTGVQLGTVEKP